MKRAIAVLLGTLGCDPTYDVVGRGTPPRDTGDANTTAVGKPAVKEGVALGCPRPDAQMYVAGDDGALFAFDPATAEAPKILGTPQCPGTSGPPLAIAMSRDHGLVWIDAEYAAFMVNLLDLSCEGPVSKVAPAENVSMTFAGDGAGGEMAYVYDGAGLSQGQEPWRTLSPLGVLPVDVRGLVGTDDGRLYARYQTDSDSLGLAQLKIGGAFAGVSSKIEVPVALKENIDDQGVAYSAGSFYLFGPTIRRISLGDPITLNNVMAWPKSPSRTIATSSSCTK